MSAIAWENFKLHLSPYLFVIYTLVWTLVCFLVEFSPTFRSGAYWLSYSIFGCYNLSISILFFALVGLTTWEKWTFLRVKDSRIIGIGATVFFLRLGAVLFSFAAIVLWGVEFFLAFADDVRPTICIFRTCLYIIFHAAQLVFIWKSQKIVFHCDRLIVYFGLAHTIAVNLWVWVSLCIAKSGIGKDSNETYHIDYDRASTWALHATEKPTVVDLIFDKDESTLRVVKLLGSSAITLLTGNVEFCLIAVGVCLSLLYTVAFSENNNHHRKANYIGFNYKNTEISLAAGYILVVILALCNILGNILRESHYLKAAGMIMGIFGLSYYSISIIVCLVVFHCLFAHIIRNQEFMLSESRDAMPHEKTINVIFLLVGASGEVLYCYMGLLGVIRGDDLSDDKGLALATFVIRAFEVLVQSLLLFYLLKRGSRIEPCGTIGKQSITFLIVLNLILFGFHTMEVFYAILLSTWTPRLVRNSLSHCSDLRAKFKGAWNFLHGFRLAGSIRSFGFPDKLDSTSKLFFKISLPLVVFFRFHASVCFAEIWKMYFHLDPRTCNSSERAPSSLSVITQNLNAETTQRSAETLMESPILDEYQPMDRILNLNTV
ncbi:Protein CBG01497 [Caenorhabditis briggsae]|uniref:Protein CBG01497 n=1 Tax=Caenorhabditis briggsae TaxID=6238 RepID=A8WQJ9_CAEBR|nr:Protein CBG01497 [Caenorhabditis briggsae]CAP22757.2 Protein CBG01497 [Caenorhabditis briggsae]